MNDYNPVGWFEIPVTDLDRAEAFYTGLLGIELTRQPAQNGLTMSWFPWKDKAKGATGALVRSPHYQPSADGAGVIVYFTAADLAATLARVGALGGKIIAPATVMGEYGTIARIEDSEGNHICLHSRKTG